MKKVIKNAREMKTRDKMTLFIAIAVVAAMTLSHDFRPDNPYLGAVSVGGMYNDTLLYKSDGELQSTDSYKGHSVALPGIRSADQLSADAVQRQYDRSNSCLDLHGTEQIYREPVLKSVSKERGWVIYHVKIPTEIEEMPLTAPLSIHTTFCLH